MIALPAGTQVWIAADVTDLRRGFTGLSGVVQTVLDQDPFSGHVFVFRGRRGDLIRCCGGTATDSVCCPNGSSADGSFGREHPAAQWR